MIEQAHDTLSQDQRSLIELLARYEGVAFDTFPVSSSQQRLWFLDQLEPGSCVYNMPVGVRLTGALDIKALGQSLDELVARHEALRTVFTTLDGQPVQVVLSELKIGLERQDLGGWPAQRRAEEAERVLTAEARRPFDLAQGPLLRAMLVRLRDDEHILLLVMHHIISDGWSIGILLRELITLYDFYAAPSATLYAPLPALPIQYADFAVAQQDWLASQDLETQLDYWRGRLGGALPTLDLPTDRPRSAAPSSRGAREPLELSGALSAQVREISRREDVTPFMLLLAAFKVLLFRYTGQADLLVGAPIANRPWSETEGLIGCFINTVVLRSDLAGNPSFRALLQQVRQVTLQAYAHQDVPFEKLVEELQPARASSHTPLFQVMFALQNAPMPSISLPGLTLAPVEIDNQTAKFDLLLNIEDAPEGFRGWFEYRTDLFDRPTIGRMAGHFQTLLEGVVEEPEGHIAWLPLLSQAEQHMHIQQHNQSAADYPRDACFQVLFEAQAAQHPDHIAVTYEHQQLSYGTLNTRANQLAHHLRSLGVGPDTLVAICMERSLEVLVAIVGVLKAGGAYLPLDPAYPPERLQFMLSDSQAAVLLIAQEQRTTQRVPDQEQKTDSTTERKGVLHTSPADHERAYHTTPQQTVLDLVSDWPTIAQQPNHNPRRTVLGQQRAYVIYTSGSTGRPKGVMVMQRGLLNLCYGLRAFFDDPHVQHTGLITSISFDISVNQIFPTLLFGRTLHIVPDALKLDSRALLRFLDDEQIHLLDAVPSYLASVLQDVAPQRVATKLRYLLIGGEKLEKALLEAIFTQLGEAVAVVNIYGLTEITDINALGVLRSDELEGEVTVGRPLQNNRIYLTSALGALQPIGVIGEVCVSGESVSRGYLNRPELTAEKFVPCPFEQGTLMVRTGDLGRRREDGRIVILGRADSQVKLRGYRIELGEIEALLLQHEAVREGVVVAREDVSGTKRLVAYVVPSQEQRTENKEQSSEKEASQFSGELRSFLKQKLPDYMVPALFVALEVLPRTPNGKIDRKALPAPGIADMQTVAFVAPRTPLEETLAQMWSELLGIERVGVHDSFFELGGHSLLITRLNARLRDTLQVELPLRAIYEGPTVAELAGAIQRARQHSPQAQEQTIAPVSRAAHRTKLSSLS